MVECVIKKEIVTYTRKKSVLKLTKEEYETLKGIILKYLKENDNEISLWRELYGDLKVEYIHIYINYPASPCVFEVKVFGEEGREGRDVDSSPP